MPEDDFEKRSAARLEYSEAITLETLEVGGIHKARMSNYSKTGLYFESNFCLTPGAEVFVGINHSPYATSAGIYECYRTTIKWRKFLEHSAFDYGYGVELIETVSRGERPPAPSESRSHLRQSCSIPTLIQSHQRSVRGLIQNASCGGVFIQCSQALSKGQRVSLTIPLRKKRKIVIRSGEIVWTDANGVGIKFNE